jgi:hypothetical protein
MARQPNLGRGRSAKFRLAGPFALRTRGGAMERGGGVSRGVVARAGSASANGLDLWADRVSVAAFDFGPDSDVFELASSDDLADAISDQLARARRAAARRAAACLDYAVPDDFTQVADWLQQRAADGA